MSATSFRRSSIARSTSSARSAERVPIARHRPETEPTVTGDGRDDFYESIADRFEGLDNAEDVRRQPASIAAVPRRGELRRVAPAGALLSGGRPRGRPPRRLSSVALSARAGPRGGGGREVVFRALGGAVDGQPGDRGAQAAAE